MRPVLRTAIFIGIAGPLALVFQPQPRTVDARVPREWVEWHENPVFAMIGLLAGVEAQVKAGMLGGRMNNGLARVQPELARLYALQELENECANGGLEQFLWNLSGPTIPHAIDGLKMIGQDQAAAVLARVPPLFGAGGVPEDHSIRRDAIASIRSADPKVFETIEAELARALGAVEVVVCQRLIDYVKKHPEQFFRD
jgi:hypothetical protein